MEIPRRSAMSVATYQTARCHNPQDHSTNTSTRRTTYEAANDKHHKLLQGSQSVAFWLNSRTSEHFRNDWTLYSKYSRCDWTIALLLNAYIMTFVFGVVTMRLNSSTSEHLPSDWTVAILNICVMTEHFHNGSSRMKRKLSSESLKTAEFFYKSTE
jgi:hypothetical protein